MPKATVKKDPGCPCGSQDATFCFPWGVRCVHCLTRRERSWLTSLMYGPREGLRPISRARYAYVTARRRMRLATTLMLESMCSVHPVDQLLTQEEAPEQDQEYQECQEE